MKTEFLKGLGLETEVINQIMAEHGKTLNREKEKSEAKVSDYNEKTIALNEAEKEMRKLRGQINEVDTYKTKYEEASKQANEFKATIEQIKNENEVKFNEFKSQVEAEKSLTQKKLKAEKRLLEDGLNPDVLPLIIDKIDLSKAEFENGDFKDWASIGETVKSEHSKFYPTTQARGAQAGTSSNGSGIKADYKAMLEAARKSGNTQEAVRIKTEAAKTGTILI